MKHTGWARLFVICCAAAALCAGAPAGRAAGERALTVRLDTSGPAAEGWVDGSTWTVDWEAVGANDGTSWQDAFTGLQPALDVALPGDQIWVAAGTYTPSAEHGGSGDRYKSFQMKNGVGLYGGFDPSVGDVGWDDRDWVNNVTALSGDIGAPGNRADNCYHAFYHPSGTGLNASAVLDGFVVTGGNANGPLSPNDRGGGMYNEFSSPALTHCTFTSNFARSFGGGMINDSSSPILADCTFAGNWTNSSGGGMANHDNSSPALTDCTFVGNSAWDGGAMHNIYSAPTLINCTFTGNSAEYNGAGVYNTVSSPVLTHCIFTDNSADESGGALWSWPDSNPTLTNCILWGDTAGEIYGPATVSYSDVQGGYAGAGNINADPLWVDPASGDYHLSATSPCIDAGTNGAPNLPPYDFEGDERILDGDGDRTATADMGVDELATTMHVAGLELTKAGTGPWRLTVRGLVHDTTHAPLPGVQVTVQWLLPQGAKAYRDATTGAQGAYRFQHTTPAAGQYRVCVAQLVRAGYTYARAGNQPSPPCREITLP